MTDEGRIAELEHQLAAEREARLRAEAACAALRAMLDEVADAAGLRDGHCNLCIEESCDLDVVAAASRAHDRGCVALRLLHLLASPDPGAELLEAGRLAHGALRSMDRDCCFSRQMDSADEHDDDCPVGQALAAGERWFGDKEGAIR